MKRFFLGIVCLFSTIVTAQTSPFADTWISIDSLELAGKISSADSLTQQLSRQALQEEKYLDFIKGKIYHYKFYQVNHENANNYILKDINEALAKIPSPFVFILDSYKAEILEDYYRQNRYKINGRSSVDDPDAQDINTWSSETFKDSIVAAYGQSLRKPEALAELPNEEIGLLLKGHPFNRNFQPTAFDLLAGRAIDFFSDSSIFTSEISKEGFDWENEQLFATTSEFLQLKIRDTAVSGLRVLKLYQQVEGLNAKKEHLEPLVYWTIQRLKFVQNKSELENKSALFLNSLEKMSRKFQEATIQAYIRYEMAYQYYHLATSENPQVKDDSDYRIKAVDLLDEVIEKYPNTSSSQKARRLRASITSPTLDSKVPEYLAVNEPGRIFLSYKNIDTLYAKILKLPKRFPNRLGYRERDSIVRSTALKYKDSTLIELPGKKDYKQHSTEVLLEGRSAGTYLVYLYNHKGYDNYGFYQVSDISVSETIFDKHTILQARDRQTGKPLKKVEIVSFDGDSTKISRGHTDRKGALTVRNRNSSNDRNSFFFIKDKDSLNSNYSLNYYSNNDGDQSPRAKTLFFLDRAIYRPGQKVFFKGVLLRQEKDSTSTVPNEFVPVFIEDPNGKEIEKFRFKTNEYGSFSGSFTIPKTGITGEFRIHSEEDVDSETPFWNKIWDEGEYSEGYTRFSVEEYKRPSFEVSFDTIKESFALNDTVQVKGNASSFMGAPISSAKVKYEIKREQFIDSWWYGRYSGAVVIKTDSITTDENGDFQIHFLAKAEKDKVDDPDLIYRYTVNASVTDISGETREGEVALKLGNKNLLTELQLQEKVNPGDTLKLSLKTTNLNDNLVPVTGTLKIFKLKAPDRILKERLWEAPEFNNISEEQFKKLFPHEPYKEQLKPEDWPKETLVYETNFESDGDFEDFQQVQNHWKEGKYLVEVETRSNSNSAVAKKIFQVTNPGSKYLADNQRLLVSVLNEDPGKDGYADLQVQTAYKDLVLTIMAFDENNRLFEDIISVDGKKSVKIPLQDARSKNVRILVSGVRNNSLLEDSRQISLGEKAKNLNITTNTFRNKIQPGLEETWSFSIKNEEGQVPDAEVLASMYDASLDQFKVGEWNTNPGYGRSWINFPRHNNSTVGAVLPLDDNFPSLWKYRPMEMTFDKLSFFGFQPGSSNSWQYRSYLASKKKEKEKKEIKIGAIKGIVTDEEGLGLPGVNVVVKGSTKGAQTDFDGEFAIDAGEGDVLVFSYVGFASREYTIVDKGEIYISLETDAAHLDEVVTLGYAVEEPVAGEVTTMAFQGKVAGVEVRKGPGGNIRIRGSSSVGGTEMPLFIVDGKIVEEYDLEKGDILSLEVLKSAEATALYGARAANGAIVVSTRNGLKDLENVEARKNLDETAFFFPDLKLGEDGNLEFSFTTPEALSSWKLRLLAHTKDWTTGKLQKTVRTQKDLNVIPNAPRFLREGDQLMFKAKVSNLSSEAMTGNAVLQLFNAVTMEPVDIAMGNTENVKSFRMKSSQSEVVAWQLKVPDTIPAVTYRILAKAGDFSDGEENMLPVLKNRMLVKESMPIFVRSGETETFTFESLKNNASETLQNHQFSLEYTSNPAWYAIQSLPYLMEYEHECAEQIFSRIFANSVGNKIVTSQPEIREVFEEWRKDSSLVSNLEKNEELKSILLAETPWVMDAESETIQKKRIAELFDTKRIEEQMKNRICKSWN